MSLSPSSSTSAIVKAYLKGDTSESEWLEFKTVEKLGTNEGKRDVVKPLTAMANTSGGVLWSASVMMNVMPS